MAKFIKFDVVNTAAIQPTGPRSPIMVNVDKILSYLATGATGANAKTLVIGLDNGGIAGATNTPDTLTLTVSTSTSAATNPTFTTGQDNPLVKALVYAMTANPGGVSSICSLGKDHAATPAQLYWRTAVWS
jgi:hypothetical protein